MLEDEMSTPEVETSTRPNLEMAYDLDHIGRSIEAILMVVDEPVTEITLASVLQVPVEQIQLAINALQIGRAHV